MPIVSRGKLVGFFGIGAPAAATLRHRRIFRRSSCFGRHAAIAIENAMRYQRERARNERSGADRARRTARLAADGTARTGGHGGAGDSRAAGLRERRDSAAGEGSISSTAPTPADIATCSGKSIGCTFRRASPAPAARTRLVQICKRHHKRSALRPAAAAHRRARSCRCPSCSRHGGVRRHQYRGTPALRG